MRLRFRIGVLLGRPFALQLRLRRRKDSDIARFTTVDDINPALP